MKDSDIIASIGAIVSFFALIISLKSFFVAKKSLNIAAIQHDQRSLGINLYYIDAYKWKKDRETYISFALRFTNLSTLNDTISKIELHIEFRDKKNATGKVKIEPNTSVTPINLKNHTDIIKQPLNLSEKSAKSGWITFKLPELITNELTIDLYRVIAESIDKKTISIETHIINEV
ncbi:MULTISPECIES: hypothetical protein [unclassified Citrobacter]|uniref:hypothetical protein n=1 Tax=Citrobacter TaxID=544 RepID=UPI0015DC569A|nr:MULTISPECIES: hypothetical protein [unclassified Citrobacter]MDM3326647.1 hypothetical protein [Citrobacter sp. Cb130]QLK38876.1 hypothetical protein GPJ68_15615 [Citrobacter sp. 172116965]